MNYETEIIHGRKLVVRHIFKGNEIKVGSVWAPADGGNWTVTIEDVKYYPPKVNTQYNEYGWFDVYYSWYEKGIKKIHDKEVFCFQCRYCLVIE
jgi:hypothetical protein